MAEKHIQADAIDTVEYAIALAIAENPELHQHVDCPLEHTFTPGLYSRKIFMPKDLVIVSEVHNTEHQFVILEGAVSVWTKEDGWKILYAPHLGVTKPETRRVLITHTDCVWATFHSTLLQTVEEIEDNILEKYLNPLMDGRHKQNKFIPSNQLEQ